VILTKGRDKFGNKYTVDGGRHSGDHNTSCGNSLLQGLALAFCLCYLLSPSEPMRYAEMVEKIDFAALLLGDDNEIALLENYLLELGVDVGLLTATLLRLGLKLEPKVHTGPHAKYMSSFCSSRFYPVEGGKCVLAPGIGRGLAKSGWYTNPPANMHVEKLLRADAIGRLRDCDFIPFLGPMWRKNLQLTTSVVGEEVFTKSLRRDFKYRTHQSEVHEACDETYAMVEAVYGLTRDHEEVYKCMLESVKSLPCIVDMAVFHRAMVQDGVLDDVYDEAVCASADGVARSEYRAMSATNARVLQRPADDMAEERKYGAGPIQGQMNMSAVEMADVWDSDSTLF